MASSRATLYGSSATLEGIRNIIADFYGGERKTLIAGPGPASVWTVHRANGAQIEGVRVVLTRGVFRGRFRFEKVGV